MAVHAGPGPERESVKLPQWEADAFMLIVEFSTFSAPRYQLSYALRQVRAPQGAFVLNKFHLNVQQIWRY
jgi:hypothetical protein